MPLPNNQEKKIEKIGGGEGGAGGTPGYIIILHKYTINDNHMMYGSGDTNCKDRIFCHFGPFFALLPH